MVGSIKSFRYLTTSEQDDAVQTVDRLAEGIGVGFAIVLYFMLKNRMLEKLEDIELTDRKRFVGAVVKSRYALHYLKISVPIFFGIWLVYTHVPIYEASKRPFIVAFGKDDILSG